MKETIRAKSYFICWPRAVIRAAMIILAANSIRNLPGSWNALQAGDFEPGKFLIELAANLVIAALMTALGQQMKYDFALIVSFIFAYRLFRNINFMSRKLYKDIQTRRQNRAREKEDGLQDKPERPDR